MHERCLGGASCKLKRFEYHISIILHPVNAGLNDRLIYVQVVLVNSSPPDTERIKFPESKQMGMGVCPLG